MLSRLVELVLANALWLLCSLPLFTLGASTTALYDATLQLVFGENISIIATLLQDRPLFVSTPPGSEGTI